MDCNNIFCNKKKGIIMKKILNHIKTKISIIAFILGLFVATTISAATIILQSSDIEYNYSKSDLKDSSGNNVKDVQTAIDELYEKATTKTTSCLRNYSKTPNDEYTYRCIKG